MTEPGCFDSRGGGQAAPSDLADAAAALVRGGTFVTKYASRFLSVLKPVRCVVYGSPNEAVKQALAPFSPAYVAPAAGFSR